MAKTNRTRRKPDPDVNGDRTPAPQAAANEAPIGGAGVPEHLGCDEAHVQYDRFLELASEWKRETRFVSNITRKSMHIAYQKIIGMGRVAIPLILQDLQKNGPNDWFWALHVITDVNPITEDIAGDMRAMTEAWLAWGKKTGYLRDSPRKTKAASRI